MRWYGCGVVSEAVRWAVGDVCRDCAIVCGEWAGGWLSALGAETAGTDYM